MWKNIRKGLYLLEDSALIALVVSMVVLSFSQLVMRNLSMSGMAWSDAALRANVLWLAMFGALRASRLQSHISIDLVTRYVSSGTRSIIHFVVSIACFAICITAAWYSYQFVLLEIEDGMVAFLNVPVWLTEAIIPFAFALIGLRFLTHAATLPELHDDQP